MAGKCIALIDFSLHIQAASAGGRRLQVLACMFTTSGCRRRSGATIAAQWLPHWPGASGGKRGRGDAGQCVCAVNSIKRFIHQRTRTHRGPMANTNTRAAGFNPLSAGWAKLRA